MRPVNEQGHEWDAETTALAFDEVRDKAKAELHARDERLSGGRLNAENRYSPCREVPRKRAEGSDSPVEPGVDLVPDPALASIKHTGEEMLNLTKRRWAEWCEKPRPEGKYRDELAKRRRADRLDAMKAAGAEVDRSTKRPSDALQPAAV